MPILTQQDINRHLNRTYIDRGRAYYRQGRVLEVDIQKQGQQLVSQVRGSGRKTYQVIVNLDGGTKVLHDIRGHCSCPVGYNCKHVAAVLFSYANELTPAKPQTIKKPTETPLDPNLRTWLKNIPASQPTEPTTTAASTNDYQLHYVLGIDTLTNNQQQMIVEMYKTRRLKSRDAWSKGKRLWRVSESNATFLTEQDHELARLLDADLSDYYYSHEDNVLKGDVASYLLQRILKTGRCHWADMHGPIFSLGADRQGVLDWHIQNQEAQIMIKEPAGLALLPLPNPWYFDAEQHQIGQLQTEWPDTVASSLVQAPAIPITQCAKVAELLQKQFPDNPLPLPSVEIRKPKKGVKPVPVLTLLSLETGGYYYSDAWKDYAELMMDYEGHRVHPMDSQATLLNQVDDHFEQVNRQLSVEKKHQKALLNNGLKKDSSNVNNTNLAHGLRYKHPEGEEGWITFVSQQLPELREQGWKIEIDEDFRFNLVEPDDWYAEIEEGSGEDWFNLELGVTIDGKPFNLLTTLVNFIQRESQARTLDAFLDHAPDKELRLPLEDGRLLRVPFGKVQHIIETLVELYDPKALDEDGNLTLSRYQATQLTALSDAQLKWGGDQGPRRFAEQLANFDGIHNVEPPVALEANLRDYQKQGLNWLQFLREYELSGILADDMGLGKTVQALAHILIEKEAGRAEHPSLVIAPTSLMVNWARETEKFAPSLSILTLQGANRQTRFEEIIDHDVVLSTYPLLPRDDETLLAQQWHILILDEAQYIKNPRSKVAMIARKLKANHRLCLTGTPIENHLGELWSQFHFLMPGLLGDEKRFRHIFRKPIEVQGDQKRQKQLKQRLAPFILRREKALVAKELPEKTEIISDVELTGTQQQLYETVRVAMHDKIRKEIDKKGIQRSQIIILDALLKLRQICCDPRLLKMAAAKKVKESAKLERLMEILPEMINEGRRVLLFSQFTSMLALIEEELAQHKIPYVKLTGQTVDRATPIDRFQNEEVPLFLISLKAGGAGLNLTAADTVIHYDPWWNPAVERQATDRAHRIGQKNKVFVYKFITQGTVEEKINNLQQKKQALADALFDGKQSKTALTREDLQNLFEPLTNA